MIRVLLAPVLALGAMFATPAQAYWDWGHETVASIAYRNVDSATRAQIDQLLKSASLLETPECPIRTLEEASVWADCIKKMGVRFSYASNWHYQNVNICKPFDIKSNCPDGNCVSAQITRNAKLLQDKDIPKRERVMALAFLVHFVGDLHQPMHAGDRGDLGGNRARSTYGIYSAPRLNLHTIWDGWLAERAISTRPPLVRIYNAEERAKYGSGTVEEWSRESYDLANKAYAAVLGGDACAPYPERAELSNEAINELVEPARQQVLNGGLRLARLLNEALG